MSRYIAIIAKKSPQWVENGQNLKLAICGSDGYLFGNENQLIIEVRTILQMINSLKVGALYVLKDARSSSLIIQVAPGGDCAVFAYQNDNPEYSIGQEPLFRVLVNEPDLKRNWAYVGLHALSARIDCCVPYGDSDTAQPARYRTYLNDIDNRKPISEDEFQSLERLAVWSTANIIDRVAGQVFFPSKPPQS